MKRINWILSACFLFSTLSCDKKEDTDVRHKKMIFDHVYFEKSAHIDDFNRVIQRQHNNLQNLEKDEDFIFDYEYFSSLLTQKTLSSAEGSDLTKMISELGFSNMDELYEYDRVIKLVSQELYNNTDFFESEGPNNSNYFNEYFEQFINPYQKSCLNAFSVCVNQAHAQYTFNILVCTGTAISIGAITAGWGGVVFQLICSGSAYWKFSSGLDGCYMTYEQC